MAGIETVSVVFHHHRNNTIVAIFKSRAGRSDRRLQTTYVLKDVSANSSPEVLLQALLDAAPWKTWDHS